MIKMYITKFIRSDGKPDEDYYYYEEKDAINHLNLFFDDDSGLYKKIQVIDDVNDEVIMTLPFDNGVAGMLNLYV